MCLIQKMREMDDVNVRAQQMERDQARVRRNGQRRGAMWLQKRTAPGLQAHAYFFMLTSRSMCRWVGLLLLCPCSDERGAGCTEQGNQQLKSQLFDSFQTEKALKAQMEGLGMSTLGVGDSAKVARLEGELAGLQSALATRDNEHKELMAICTDLISQVETLKAQQNQ